MTPEADGFRVILGQLDQEMGDIATTATDPDDQEEATEPEQLPILPAGRRPQGDRPPVLVDGILDQGDLTVLGAGRAVGKSWWGMSLAMMLAEGRGLFMGTFQVRRAVRVLYCHGELDDWGAYDRWQKLTLGTDPPANLTETFEPWRIRVTSRRVQTSPHISDTYCDALLDGRVEQTIKEQGTEVLILDPWAVYYAGEENSNDQAEAALSTLRDLQQRYRLSIIVLHHFSKADPTSRPEPEDLWRGASRLPDWAATRVTLIPHYTAKQAAEQGMTRHQARCYADAKFLRRRHAPPEDFSIRWNVETGQWEKWRDSHTDDGPGSRAGLSVTDVALKTPPAGWESVGKAAAAFATSEGTMRRLLEQAVAQGIMEEFIGPRRARAFRNRDGKIHSANDSANPLRNTPPAESETTLDLQ